jgi:hypothetical protein
MFNIMLYRCILLVYRYNIISVKAFWTTGNGTVVP